MKQAPAVPLHNFTRDDEHSIPFRLVSLEKRTGYDYSVPHRHNYYEVFLFRRGGGTHLIDFQTFSIGDGSIHFVSPGQVHVLQREPDSEGSILLFSRDFFFGGHTHAALLQNHPLLNNRSLRPIITAEAEAFQHFEAIVHKMKEELTEENPYHQDLLRLYLNEFLYKSLQLLKPLQEANSELFTDFQNLLERHFFEWHLVKQYAQGLQMTEKTLTEKLKERTGRTTLELINERLLLEAKRLLRFSELTIKEVGFQIGFEDPSHFSKFFRNLCDCSPKEFREASEKYQH